VEEQTNPAELVLAARSGDDEAFYRLMVLHHDKLYRIAFAYFRSEADALEAIQEVTYRAYMKLHSLRKPDYAGTWLVRILINYCNDERRRRSRQTEYRFGGVPDERADGTEIRAVRDSLESALDVLEPRQKQIVILKYFEDLTIREIAAAMQYPDGTIKTWLYKALRKLKDYMRKDGEPD